MEALSDLCYKPVLSQAALNHSPPLTPPSSFPIWFRGDFGPCFEHLFLVVVTNALFGATSAFYAGAMYVGRGKKSRRMEKRIPVLVARMTISVVVAMTALVELIGSFWLETDRPYAIVLSEVVLIVSWGVHAVACRVMSASPRYEDCGPLLVKLAWYPTLVGSLFRTWSSIGYIAYPTHYTYLIELRGTAYLGRLFQVVAFVLFVLQCGYAVTLFVGAGCCMRTKLSDSGEGECRTDWKRDVKRTRAARSCYVLVVEDQREETEGEEEEEEEVEDEEGGETERLITSGSKYNRGGLNYGSIQAQDVPRSIPVHSSEGFPHTASAPLAGGVVSRRLGSLPNASEDDANVLSKLFFYWVGPLMKRGALGNLDRPEDLPPLPRSLETSRVRKRLQAVLTKKRQSRPETVSLVETESECARRPDCMTEPSTDSTARSQQSSASRKTPELASASFDTSSKLLHSFTHSLAPSPSASIGASWSGAVASDRSPLQHGAQPLRRGQSDGRTVDARPSPSFFSKLSTRFFLFGAMNHAFGWHYYPLGLLKLLADALGFAGPLLLHALVAFMENRTEPMLHGYLYALGLFLSTFFASMLNTHFTYQVNKVGLKVRGSLITEVYRKTVGVSLTTLSTFSTGQVVNFMSTDTDRIVNFCMSFHQFWSLPFQITISLYLLYREVGLAFLTGLAFSVLLIPVNYCLARKIGQLSTAMMTQKDARVKTMSEILIGIRVIKLSAWEDNFVRRVRRLRGAELKSLAGRKYLDALCVYFWATTPVVISVLTFATYVAMGQTLTAAKVFTSIALFNILISPLNAFPWVLNGLVEAWVSAKRVQQLLLLEERDLQRYYLGGSRRGGCGPDQDDDEVAISISGGSFTWVRETPSQMSVGDRKMAVSRVDQHGLGDGRERDGEERLEEEGEEEEGEGEEEEDKRKKEGVVSVGRMVLRVPLLEIKRGQLVGVVGKVGSGKSSLLAAITAEMKKMGGLVCVAGYENGFGLATQESWIQQASFKDNILFGAEFDAQWYNDVLHACALHQDLEILPEGDETEVGENGATLSGGQKTRLALARAVYQDKSTYLFDDPLAAVDAHVARHIFEHCISGLLRGKTRILCTHHHSFLQRADLIIELRDGVISRCGDPRDILGWETAGPSSSEGEREAGEEEKEEEGGVKTEKEYALVQEEEKEEGVVKIGVYWAYWSAVGAILTPLVFLSLVLMQASRNISDWWLAYWISHSHNSSSINTNTSIFNITPPVYYQSMGFPVHAGMDSKLTTWNGTIPDLSLYSASDSLTFYLGIYGGIAAANSVFTLFRAFLYAKGGIQAATALHAKLLRSVMRAPVVFFDTNPIGRIINRFSSDLYAIDDSLPFIMNILLAQLFGLAGSLAVTCFGVPWFVLLLVPLALVYYDIQKYYRRTSRELKRLSTVTLSPVYAHFSETLSGLWTIRALDATARFRQKNERNVETNQRANFGSYAVAQWLGIRLQMMGVVTVGGVAFIAMLEHHFNTVDPSLVGLAISYALAETNLLSGVVTSFTETEKEMVSVERALQYIKGAPMESGRGVREPPHWPREGVVEFRNAVLEYRTGIPPALDGVSFVTRPGEKVGVVGRTGAGKSSLFRALFRTVELTRGRLFIDGVDIATLSLKTLRSALVIIPQDPFLFSGTVRENLDPCDKSSDEELRSVLERCRLEEAVGKLGGLSAEVEERGRVFSVGQRQLVCLARALLSRKTVVCIDEATANVDMETDSQIQEVIRREFHNSTVITIAHRIATVLRSDRILVMERGRVRECGAPHQLTSDPNSLFSALYSEQCA